MTKHRRTWTTAIFVAVSLLASCSGPSATNTGASESASGDPEIVAIVEDLNNYWQQADAELGFDYEPVPVDRVGTAFDGLTCDNKTLDADELADNAYVDPSCAEGITVAYDPGYLSASLAQAEATMAHEWGHVIQAQAAELDLSEDPDGLPIDGELQADCFAGAWAAERAGADIDRLRIDTAKAGDPGDVPIDDPHAHGTPQDRETAFDVGLDGGPIACINELIDALPQ